MYERKKERKKEIPNGNLHTSGVDIESLFNNSPKLFKWLFICLFMGLIIWIFLHPWMVELLFKQIKKW